MTYLTATRNAIFLADTYRYASIVAAWTTNDDDELCEF